MELHTCAYEPSNAYNSDYEKINIGYVIMCFLIVYSTTLSIVLSVKQLIQVIKEEELLNEEKEEEEEEEVIKEVEFAKEVEAALQTNKAYTKQIRLLLKKKIKNTARAPWQTQLFWDNFTRSNKDNICVNEVKHITEILMCLYIKDIETINKELDEEIIFNAKKAGLFVFHSDYDGAEFYKDTYRLAKIATQIGNYERNERANRENKQSQLLTEHYEGRLKV